MSVAATSSPVATTDPPDPTLTAGPALRAVILLAVTSAVAMEFMSSAAVNVVLPDLMGAFGASLDQISWVSTVYLAAFTAVMPLSEWVTQRLGRKQYFIGSILLYVAASVGCAASHTLAALLVWRGVQGAAGAALLVRALVIINRVFPLATRGAAMVGFSVGILSAKAFGPVLAGHLVDRADWRSVFLLNVPVGLFSAAIGVAFVPRLPRSAGTGFGTRSTAVAGSARRSDKIGIALVVLSLAASQVLLGRGQRDEWFASPLIVWLAAASLLSTALLVWWQLHGRNAAPAVPLRTLSDRNLAVASVYGLAFGVTLAAGLYVLPLFLRNVQSHTAEQTAGFLMVDTLSTLVGTALSVGLVRRVPKTAVLTLGMGCFVVSMLLLGGRLTTGTPDGSLYLPLVLRGLSVGLQIPALAAVALSTLPPRSLGEAEGLYLLLRQLGGAFGVAAVVLLVDLRMTFHSGHLAQRLSLESSAPAISVVRQVGNGLRAHGLPIEAGYNVLRGSMVKQAMTLAYADVCYALAAFAAAAGILLLLLQGRRAGARPRPAAPVATAAAMPH